MEPRVVVDFKTERIFKGTVMMFHRMFHSRFEGATTGPMLDSLGLDQE